MVFLMTANASLQCAQAAVGFTALTMGYVVTELERLDQLPSEAVWKQASQAVSQWLRQHYGDELVEQAKATLDDAATEQDGDIEQIAEAARVASTTVLSLLLTHGVNADIAEQVRSHVSTAVSAAWQDAYGDSPETEA